MPGGGGGGDTDPSTEQIPMMAEKPSHSKEWIPTQDRSRGERGFPSTPHEGKRILGDPCNPAQP